MNTLRFEKGVALLALALSAANCGPKPQPAENAGVTATAEANVNMVTLQTPSIHFPDSPLQERQCAKQENGTRINGGTY